MPHQANQLEFDGEERNFCGCWSNMARATARPCSIASPVMKPENELFDTGPISYPRGEGTIACGACRPSSTTWSFSCCSQHEVRCSARTLDRQYSVRQRRFSIAGQTARVAAAVLPDQVLPLLAVSGAGWIAAFGGCAVNYAFAWYGRGPRTSDRLTAFAALRRSYEAVRLYRCLILTRSSPDEIASACARSHLS